MLSIIQSFYSWYKMQKLWNKNWYFYFMCCEKKSSLLLYNYLTVDICTKQKIYLHLQLYIWYLRYLQTIIIILLCFLMCSDLLCDSFVCLKGFWAQGSSISHCLYKRGESKGSVAKEKLSFMSGINANKNGLQLKIEDWIWNMII